MADRDSPLIVQGDMTLLLEVASMSYAPARDTLARFAELIKSPEHMHTYRISDLSLWNAASLGVTAEQVLADLRDLSRYPVPPHVEQKVHEVMARYGKLTLTRLDDRLWLRLATPELAELLQRDRGVARWIGERLSATTFTVPELHRGRLKQALIHAGWPADDRAGYRHGEPLAVELRRRRQRGGSFAIRDYQREAVEGFHAGGDERGGAGVVVLPCGAGKTIVGLAAMARVGCETLILTTSVTAARQWIEEILDKTHLTRDQVGEYTGQAKELRPVTVTTYQLVTHRRRRDEDFLHLDLFRRMGWGLVIYDEVHLLPAPVFSVTAEIQSCRRLGLTATLVREDGRQDDVFALIGPKRFDVPWKELENQGWIARAHCSEVRLAMGEELRMTYAAANKRARHRLAATNPAKAAIARQILAAHEGHPTLIIGMYLDHLRALASELDAPLITGQTSQRRRDTLFSGFRRGEIPLLVVSKVANFAVDLPDASVAIQISGTFGSRQEEAQRLGRLLRPKAEANQAHFYSLVSRDTVEQEAAAHRQLFLVEQGYSYRLLDAEELEPGSSRLPAGGS